jgi:hypothetical protein
VTIRPGSSCATNQPHNARHPPSRLAEAFGNDVLDQRSHKDAVPTLARERAGKSRKFIRIADKMKEYQCPMIAQFAALRSGEDIFVGKDEKDFLQCRAFTLGRIRCANYNQKQLRSARARYESFKTGLSQGNLEESDALLRQFVEASHCSRAGHQPGAILIFNEWLLEQQRADTANATNLNMDLATADSSEVDGEEHYTYRMSSLSVKEETPRRSQFAEQAQHPKDSSEAQPEQDSEENPG